MPKPRGISGPFRPSLAEVSGAEPWADTGTSAGRFRIAVLGGLAGVERDLIGTHTAVGKPHQGSKTHMGRHPSLRHRRSRKRPPDGAAGRYVAGIGGQLRPRAIDPVGLAREDIEQRRHHLFQFESTLLPVAVVGRRRHAGPRNELTPLMWRSFR